jgi:hypothetical protein
MAKKKQDAKDQDPKEQRVRTAVTAIRSRPEWREWVEGLAEFDRAPSLNDLFDRAVVAYARQIGYKAVAPKR